MKVLTKIYIVLITLTATMLWYNAETQKIAEAKATTAVPVVEQAEDTAVEQPEVSLTNPLSILYGVVTL